MKEINWEMFSTAGKRGQRLLKRRLGVKGYKKSKSRAGKLSGLARRNAKKENKTLVISESR